MNRTPFIAPFATTALMAGALALRARVASTATIIESITAPGLLLPGLLLRRAR